MPERIVLVFNLILFILVGGKHVDYVADNIVKQLLNQINRKNKSGVKLTNKQIRSHMWLFINCLIVNPTFDSQTKENMTLQSKSFGSKCEFSQKFISAAASSGIVESVLIWAKLKADKQLVKHSGKKQVIDKISTYDGWSHDNLMQFLLADASERHCKIGGSSQGRQLSIPAVHHDID